MSEGRPYCYDEQNICYAVHRTSVNPNDADRICRERHGRLAAIKDHRTQVSMESLLRTEGGSYWIGGRLHIMDQWTWVDGTRYPGEHALCHQAVDLLHC